MTQMVMFKEVGMHRFKVLAIGALMLASAPAWAIDTPRFSSGDLQQAARLAPKSGTPRYCLRAREAGDSQIRLLCATRTEWRERGVTLAGGSSPAAR